MTKWQNLYCAVVIETNHESIVDSIAYYADSMKEFKEMIEEEHVYASSDKFKIIYKLVKAGEYK